MTAAAAALLACRDALDREMVSIAGRPRPSERSNLVRRMYSLLQEDRADRRVNDLRCAWSMSDPVSRAGFPGPICNASAPGKYLANAILHAGGVVTSLWKRWDTRLIEDKVSGGRWERI